MSKDRHELTVNVLKQGAKLPEVVNLIGLPATMTIVALMVQGFCQKFNVSKNMNEGQVQDLAADIVLDATNRKGGTQVYLEELAVFFDRAAKGEFKKKNGQSFIFDRIDRGVIEEMMDLYFETDRTAAVWQIQDEINNNKKDGEIIHPRETPPIQLDKYGNDVTPKNIYDLAGTGRFGTVKALKELEKKYGHGGE